MILLVDLGNTKLKWELRQLPNTLLVQGAAIHLNHDLFHLLDKQWSDLPIPRQVWLSSVAGSQQTLQITSWVQSRWQIAPVLAESTVTAAGVRNGYAEPHCLGVDRWLGLIACWSRFRGAACIVDCGTAVTLDAIDDKGQHRGGHILPGIRLMQQAVVQQTRQVKPTSEGAAQPYSTTTADALYSGALLAIAGAINAFTEQVRSDLPDTKLIITGGDALTLLPRLRCTYLHVPNLVIEGLAVLAG